MVEVDWWGRGGEKKYFPVGTVRILVQPIYLIEFCCLLFLFLIKKNWVSIEFFITNGTILCKVASRDPFCTVFSYWIALCGIISVGDKVICFLLWMKNSGRKTDFMNCYCLFVVFCSLRTLTLLSTYSYPTRNIINQKRKQKRFHSYKQQLSDFPMLFLLTISYLCQRVMLLVW